MEERKTMFRSVVLNQSAVEDLTQLKLRAEDLIKQLKEKVEQNGKMLHSSLYHISLEDYHLTYRLKDAEIRLISILTHQEYLAIKAYERGEVTLTRGAELANIDFETFREKLFVNEIPIIPA
jgi:predicted HTH domain antitoxin